MSPERAVIVALRERLLLAAEVFDTILREALEEMAAIEGLPVDLPPEAEE